MYSPIYTLKVAGKTLRDTPENCNLVRCLEGENIKADILLREMMRFFQPISVEESSCLKVRCE